MRYSSIKKIERIERKDRYDLTVSKTSNFFANGILIHNTSGRTGHVLTIRKLRKWEEWLNKILPKKIDGKNWEYVSGTRRTILNTKTETDDGYYLGTNFRNIIHDRIKAMGLHRGETLYYEIVGFTDNGTRIMPVHKIEDKKMCKVFGEEMEYNYGCSPDSEPPWRMLVYRITMTNEDGVTTEYSWHQVKKRCAQLGLEVVPILKEPFVYTNYDELIDICKSLADGKSTLDPNHIREGIVLRIEHQDWNEEALKYKGFWFSELEDIRKNDDTFVDPEDLE